MESYWVVCTGGSWKALLAEGIVAILIGALFFVFPEWSLQFLIYSLAAVMVIIAVLMFGITFFFMRFGIPLFPIPLILGIVSLIIAIVTILNPATTGFILIIILAAMAIIGGIALLVTSVSRKGPALTRALVAVGGILLAVLGVSGILYPAFTATVFISALGVFLLCSGVILAAGGLYARHRGPGCYPIIETSEIPR